MKVEVINNGELQQEGTFTKLLPLFCRNTLSSSTGAVGIKCPLQQCSRPARLETEPGTFWQQTKFSIIYHCTQYTLAFSDSLKDSVNTVYAPFKCTRSTEPAVPHSVKVINLHKHAAYYILCLLPFFLPTEIREAFKVFDRDGNGFISKQELGMAMRSLGYMPNEVELEVIIQRLDMDGTFPEHTALMYTIHNITTHWCLYVWFIRWWSGWLWRIRHIARP